MDETNSLMKQLFLDSFCILKKENHTTDHYGEDIEYLKTDLNITKKKVGNWIRSILPLHVGFILIPQN